AERDAGDPGIDAEGRDQLAVELGVVVLDAKLSLADGLGELTTPVAGLGQRLARAELQNHIVGLLALRREFVTDLYRARESRQREVVGPQALEREETPARGRGFPD